MGCCGYPARWSAHRWVGARDHGVGRGVGPRRAASLEVSIATEHAATRERETVGEDLNDCGGDAGDNDEPGGDARGP